MQQILTLLLILAEIAQMIGNLQDLPKTPLHKNLSLIYFKSISFVKTRKNVWKDSRIVLLLARTKLR